MICISPRTLWLMLGLGGIGVAMLSLLLTTWLHLDPCHFCIAQRALFLALGLTALIAMLGTTHAWGRVVGALSGVIALMGASIAAYQSWLQMQPPGSISCMATEPGLIERMVEWLGERWPSFFLATGFCDDPGLTLFGLSLANWALGGFVLCALLAAWALWHHPRS